MPKSKPRLKSQAKSKAKAPGSLRKRSFHRKKFLWITDPWSTLDHPRDTTLRLMAESLTLGHANAWCDVRTIRLQDGEVLLESQTLESVDLARETTGFHFADPTLQPPRAFDSLHYRVDPPVDLAYIHPLQLLVLGLELRPSRAELVNPPRALLLGSEKLEGSLLGDLMPCSCASSQWESLRKFGQKESRTVLKPLHQAQSKGVELLDWSSNDAVEASRKVCMEATAGFTRPVVLQRFLPGIKDGEQRLWFLDGDLLAYARKKPKNGEFRIDMDQGGTLAVSQLTFREKRAANRIGKLLKAKRIRLAAVDLIEGCVTDFNFTSPGLLVAMEKLLNENLARKIIEKLAKG